MYLAWAGSTPGPGPGPGRAGAAGMNTYIYTCIIIYYPILSYIILHLFRVSPRILFIGGFLPPGRLGRSPLQQAATPEGKHPFT